MTEKKLLQKLKRNPNAGVEQAITLYGKAVHTICRSILGEDRESIEEAESDTFVKLWQNADKIRIDETHSLKSYLYSIARNTAVDCLRKKKGEMVELSEELVAEEAVEEVIVERVISEELHQAVAELGEPDNQIFILRYFLGCPVKEIAVYVQVTEKKVENVLLRGKKKLKDKLQERGFGKYEEFKS